MIKVIRVFIALGIIGIFIPCACAQVSSADLEGLKRTIEELQKQMRVQGEEIAALKNQLAVKSELRPAYLPSKEGTSLPEKAEDFLLSGKEPATLEEKPLVTLYDDGFWLKGKDDTLRIGGWYQADLNLYEKGHAGNDRFRNRRARLDVRGVLEENFGYRLYADFSGAAASLQEAWLEYKQFPAARLKVGQFKVPFGLEAMYSARWTDFVERSIGVTNLQPAEDLGAMFYGTPWDGRIDYAMGIFNGRRRLSDDNNDAFDLAARLVLAPLRQSSHELLKDLYFGGSLTSGSSLETLSGTSFTTAGGTSFFTYNTGIRHPDNRTRAGGEFQWIYGPGDIKAEYVGASFNDVELSGNKTDADVNSWYVSGSYVLTGERKQRNKPIRPSHPFDPAKRAWGAWEIAGRYEEFFVSGSPLAHAFATGTDRVDALTLGLNWWPNVHIRLMLDYVLNYFGDDVVVGGEALDRENLILSRAQYDF